MKTFIEASPTSTIRQMLKLLEMLGAEVYLYMLLMVKT